MDSSSTNETSKFTIAISTAILVSILAAVLVSYEFMTIPVVTAVIPVVAYVISIAMSSLYQYITCKRVDISTICIGDLGILATNLIATVILYLESLPLLKYIYGDFPPPETAIAPVPSTDPEKHYRIQFFSNIVKAALPESLTSEPMKTGIVYLYWIFWMTLVPHYTLLSLQGMC